ncbi:hypothetical protein NPIL_598351, partial [Nephila pilipes]
RSLKPVRLFLSGNHQQGYFYSSCVFLRLDGVRRPLEPLYAGPYKVVKRTPKVFTENRCQITYYYHRPFEVSSSVFRRCSTRKLLLFLLLMPSLGLVDVPVL